MRINHTFRPRSRYGRCLLAAILASCALDGSADPLHPTRDGTFWHHDSGWLFPEKIGEFVRIGMPQDVAGSSDAEAHYARTLPTGRISAALNLYFGNRSIEQEHESLSSHAEASPERSFPVGNANRFVATAVSYKASADALQRTLYWVDAGDWVVKIHVVADGTTGDDAAAADAFVRDQRWDSLGVLQPEAPTP